MSLSFTFGGRTTYWAVVTRGGEVDREGKSADNNEWLF